MKYCSKCGNPMEDDMMFCQKCGTKFESVVEIKKSDIEIKLDKMKKYNLVLDSQVISWQYLREDGERAGKITVKQDKLCEELTSLIKDILDNVSDEERDVVEREVYTYVLEMACKICKEGEKLFANYSGFKELFDMGTELYNRGQIAADTFLNQMIEQDSTYKVIAGLQALHSSRIKEVLDEDVIYNNLEYRNLTKKLAQAFNDMWTKCVKRHTDFYMGADENNIEAHWKLYLVILKGLPMVEVDSLDERGWQMAIDYWAENHNGWNYKNNFIRKRNSSRDAQRKKEQELEDKKYWEMHPEEYKQLESNKAKITEIMTTVDSVEKEIRSLENAKKTLDDKKRDIESSISDKKLSIDKLGKKIFGKKKTEAEIQILNGEIEKLSQELQSVSDEVKIAEKPIADKKLEKSNLEREIRRLEQENVDLRNK